VLLSPFALKHPEARTEFFQWLTSKFPPTSLSLRVGETEHLKVPEALLDFSTMLDLPLGRFVEELRMTSWSDPPDELHWPELPHWMPSIPRLFPRLRRLWVERVPPRFIPEDDTRISELKESEIESSQYVCRVFSHAPISSEGD
jgi:hypothetical protein